MNKNHSPFAVDAMVAQSEAAAELLLATTIFTSALLSIFPTLWNGFRRVGREMKLPH